MSRGDRSPQGHERTAQERERDRAERERRRAARGGPEPGTPPPQTPAGQRPTDPAALPPEHAVLPPEHAVLPPEPAEPEASPPEPGAHEALPPELGAPEPLRPEPGAHEAPPPELGGRELPPEPPEPAEAPAPPPEPEPVPFAPVAPDAPERHAAAAGAIVPGLPPLPRRRAADPYPPPPPARRRGHGRGSARGRAGALVALLIAIAAVILVVHSLKGSSHKSAAAPTVVRVVIPEGKTRLQIAEIAARAGMRGSYRAASRSSRLLDPAHYGAPAGTHDLEGFLFPATYEQFPHAPVSHLVDEQLVAFKEHFSSDLFTSARALHVTAYQLLTVASMVEREAGVPGDRAKIAAVIYNRLAREMPLGIDAAIYYAIELKTGVATYTKELTEAQLHIDSPYNTRTHTGLPPTPISNPGAASIEAAAHPAHASYLYYVAGADGCGEQVFSDSLAKFEADAAAYRAAVSRNGGKPPQCKKKQ